MKRVLLAMTAALTVAAPAFADQALAQSDEALADAERIKHHNTTSIVLGLRCQMQARGRGKRAL